MFIEKGENLDFFARVLKKEKRALMFARLRCCSGIWQPFYTILVSPYFAVFNQYKKYGQILTLKNCRVWRRPPPVFNYLLHDFSFVANAKKGMWYKFWKSIVYDNYHTDTDPDKKQLLSSVTEFQRRERNHKEEKKQRKRQRCEEASPNGFWVLLNFNEEERKLVSG